MNWTYVIDELDSEKLSTLQNLVVVLEISK